MIDLEQAKSLKPGDILVLQGIDGKPSLWEVYVADEGDWSSIDRTILKDIRSIYYPSITSYLFEDKLHMVVSVMQMEESE